MIHILAVGKKHEDWIEQGVVRFTERLRTPFAAKFELLPHSKRPGAEAADDESTRLLKRIDEKDVVILLDERGQNLTSPEVSSFLVENSSRQVIIIIGGAYGVNQNLKDRADLVWSLSRLVFPHQLVRLILSEQLYRAQEISRGSQYHHQ